MRQALVIGLDGLSWNVLSVLINRGVMHNIDVIKSRGVYGDLQSIIPPFTTPSWTSLSSGVNPGKHGIYSYIMPTEDYDSKLTTYKDIKYPRIHEILTLEGLSSVVINLPLSYPPIIHRGIMISDWLYPKFEIYPSTVQGFAQNYVPLDHRWSEVQNTSDYIKSLFKSMSKRLIVIKNIFLKTKWDLFFVVFSETDFLLHKIYDDIISGIGYAKEAYKIFKMIDEFLGWTVNNIKKDSFLLLVSDHGFNKYEYSIHINQILSLNEIIKYKIIKSKKLYKRTIHNNISKKKVIHIPKFIYSRIMKSKFINKASSSIFHTIFGSDAVSVYRKVYDFNSSSAFMFRDDHFGIYINTKELFKKGLNQEEVQKIQESLINILINIKNSKKGHIFEKIYSREELFKGPYTRKIPHLILLPKKGYWIHNGMAEEIISKKSHVDHSRVGIFIAYGRNIKNKDYRMEVSILDIAPTILHYLKLPIPQDTEGKVLINIFKEGSIIKKRPIEKINYLEKWNKIRWNLKK
ncbi:MAG: alkaline phosphatase family protein [Candidatus Hodarchaeota archaeon]